MLVFAFSPDLKRSRPSSTTAIISFIAASCCFWSSTSFFIAATYKSMVSCWSANPPCCQVSTPSLQYRLSGFSDVPLNHKVCLEKSGP